MSGLQICRLCWSVAGETRGISVDPLDKEGIEGRGEPEIVYLPGNVLRVGRWVVRRGAVVLAPTVTPAQTDSPSSSSQTPRGSFIGPDLVTWVSHGSYLITVDVDKAAGNAILNITLFMKAVF